MVQAGDFIQKIEPFMFITSSNVALGEGQLEEEK
jgi:hypothetical protein